jgi:hypothetical protein
MKPWHLPESLRVAGPPASSPDAANAAPSATAAPSAPAAPAGSSWARVAWTIVGLLSGGLAAYHGAKRNRGSAWQAFKWGLLGSIAPVPVLPLALAQGFAKPREDAPEPAPAPRAPTEPPADPTSP